MSRASTSDGPPAGNGTTMRMERAGKAPTARSCAAAPVAAAAAASIAETATHRAKLITTPASLASIQATELTPVVAAFSICAGCSTAAGHDGGHGLRCGDDQTGL